MTLPLFDPQQLPVFSGTTRVTTPRLRSVRFGEGYSQRVADGINIFRRTGRLSWERLTTAQAQVIEAFFLAMNGSGAFLYQVPGDAAARKWTATSWSSMPLAYGFQSFSVEIGEEFDP